VSSVSWRVNTPFKLYRNRRPQRGIRPGLDLDGRGGILSPGGESGRQPRCGRVRPGLL